MERRTISLINWALRAMVLCIVVGAICMLAYAGGSFCNKQPAGFALYDNFLSDLGRTRGWSGASNLGIEALFIISTTAGAAAIALMFIAFAKAVSRSILTSLLGHLGAGWGIISAIAFIGVAAFPMDIYPALHQTFVLCAFSSFLFAFAILAIAFFCARDFPDAMPLLLVVIAIALYYYVAVLLMHWQESLLHRMAVVQKLVVLSALAIMFLEGLWVRHILQRPARFSRS